MGFLQSLDICNFKSYKGEHSFGPFDATKILSILGQNGEGKSNFTDAIAFVFGDRSGSLRARHLRDLCFGGIAKDVKIPSKCYVSATCWIDSDNMIVFKREIVSEGRSCNFRINGVIVTHKEYVARLCERGIDGVAQNFIIQQGAVDKMGIMNSVQRTEYLEKISKSMEFKKEYDDLLKKREEKQSKQSDISSKHAAARKDLLRYKAELRSREQYEKEKQKTGLKALNIFTMELQDLLRQIGECDKLLETIRDEEQRYKDQMLAFSDKNAFTENCHDHFLNRINKNIAEKTEMRAALYDRHATFVIENRMRQERLDVLRQKICSFEQKKANLAESKNALESIIRNLSSEKVELANLEKSFTFTPDQIAKYERIQSLMTSNATGIEIQQMETDRAFMDQTVERSGNGVLALKNTLKDFDKRLEDMNHSKREKTSLAVALKSELNAALEKQNENDSQREAAGRRKEHLDTLGILYRDDQCQRASETDFALYQRHKETVKILKSKFGSKRVLGRLYELVNPSDLTYSQAIDAALGDQLNWIVVSGPHMVRECSSFLYEQDMSPEVFVALTRFKITSQKSLYASDENNYHTIGSFFELKERFYPLFSYISEGVAVCESADEAQLLMHSEVELRKAVSVDGYMFCKFTVSTFSRSLKSPALIKWMKGGDEREIFPSRNEWMAKVKKVDEELQDCTVEDLRIAAIVENLKFEHQALAREINDINSAENMLHNQIVSLNTQISDAENDHAGLQRQCYEKDKLIDTLRKQQERSSNDLYGELCNEMKISHIDVFESMHKQLNDLKAGVEKRCIEIQTLQSSIAFLEKETHQGSRDIGTNQEICEHLKLEIIRYNVLIKTDKEKLSRLDACIAAFKGELDLIVRESNSLHSALRKQNILSRQSMEKNLTDIVKRTKQTIRLKDRLLEAKTKTQEKISETEQNLKCSLNKLQKLKVPDSDCRAELVATQNVIEHLNKQLKTIKTDIRKLDDEFINVRDKRKVRFEEFFNHVNENVLELYRIVTADESAYAQLTLEDVNEPFAAGVQYACILPSKTATMFEMMSSGEQTLAALALSLAIHATLKTPLLVLDEVDAALDMHNTDRVFSFLRSAVQDGVQVAVISHRYEFLYRAEHVIGLYMNNEVEEDSDGVRRSTKALSFDATIFEDTDVRAVASESSRRQQNADWSQINFSRENSMVASTME